MVEHFVQFYEEDRFLADEVLGFIGTGLWAGEAGVVIASHTHLEDLEKRLQQSGLNNGYRSVHAGEYIAIDSAVALSEIMVDGYPDENRFMAIISSVIDRASQGGTIHVRVFSELAASLCRQGNREAGLRIEHLSNELAKRQQFSLLCAYPMGTFSLEEDGRIFHDICSAHSHVCLAESFKFPTSHDELRRTIAILHQKANALESEVARRKEIEAALHRREQELAEVDQRKDEFLAMLGHELRNPLAPIVSSLELMRVHADDSNKVTQARDTIVRQTALMTRFVDDLLDVSRITRGTIELNRKSVRLDDIVSQAIEIVRPLIEEQTHQLKLDLPEEPVWLQGDAARLAQALANLLRNAARYTDPGGAITLSAWQQNGEVVLSVADNGIGMDAALRDRIFDLFVQGRDSLARERGGLGLGLPLVRSLVRLHGGRVEAYSAGPGHGSRFDIALPLAMQAAIPHDEDDHGGARHNASGNTPKTILIVDDNVDAAEALGELLTVLGHEVHLAHDGMMAISKADGLRPDVVILDIGLPSMNGYEVARHLRADPGLRNCLLIALTGYAQERDRKMAMEAGFDHHFAKPLDIATLTNVLHRTQQPHPLS